MQAFILAVVLLGLIAFVYQGIALSSREAVTAEPPEVTQQQKP